MELWIRSQNKELLKLVNNIEIDYLDFKKYDYVQSIQNKGEYGIRCNGDLLGQYSTKERALEVLDEIQNIIKPTFINTKYNCEIKDGHNKNEFDLVMQPDESKIEIIQPTTIVYEMPEE